jgi:LacI family transcriptional regulator
MTIYDIAEAAGVSISTVSRVLNNKKNVNAETRRKILELVEKNGYTANVLARSLTTKSSKTIGVMTIDIRDTHFAHIAYTIERELSKYGYSTILCNTGCMIEEKTKYMRLLAEKQVDGLILIGSVFNDKYVETSLFNMVQDIPVVIANGSLNKDNVRSVIVDVIYGLTLCIDHLCEKGHKDIIFVRNSPNSFSGEGKLKGYIAGMERHGISISGDSIFECGQTIEDGYAIADKIIKSGVKFSAIIFCTDEVALGASRRLLEAGYKIPDDVAITGFNNSIFSKYMTPALTTVDNHFETLSVIATQLLIGLIEGRNMNTDLYIKPNLIVRQST